MVKLGLRNVDVCRPRWVEAELLNGSLAEQIDALQTDLIKSTFEDGGGGRDAANNLFDPFAPNNAML